MNAHDLKKPAQELVEQLQSEICAALEALDGEARFHNDQWERPGGGGGLTRVLTDGAVLEKAGVNTSAVFGELDESFAAQLQGEGTRFFATGISLVLHPRSPAIPTVHANFRYIVQGDVGWFGGGADLTPYLLYEEDCAHFHRVLKRACDRHDPEYYPAFKAECDRYFHLPHRDEHRGVGGIFFDGLKADDQHSLEDRFAFLRSAGESFLDAWLPIADRRREEATTEADRQWQLLRRGRYVEFNLIYDRGTAFGLKTGGRAESILMSLPPLVRFPYAPKPPDARAEALLEVLRTPRQWV